MPRFYFLNESLDIRDKKGFYDLDQEDYFEVIEEDILNAEEGDRIRVFATEKDAIMVAQEGVDPEDVFQYPVFTLEYAGKKTKTSYTIKEGDNKGTKLTAFFVQANQVKPLSATLEFVSPEVPQLKRRDLNEKPQDKTNQEMVSAPIQSIAPAKSSPSYGKRMAQGLTMIAKPTLATATGIAFWYFGGPDLVAPYLADVPVDALTNYLGSYASTAFNGASSTAVGFTSFGLMSGIQGMFNWATTKKPSTTPAQQRQPQTNASSQESKMLERLADRLDEKNDSDNEFEDQLGSERDPQFSPQLNSQKASSQKDSKDVVKTSTPANDETEQSEKKKKLGGKK